MDINNSITTPQTNYFTHSVAATEGLYASTQVAQTRGQSEEEKGTIARGEASATGSDAQSLSAEDEFALESLKRRDTEVRAHEQAHLSVAGNLAQGGANFSFTTGPDGKRYAVGGDVSIDTAAVAGDPQATLRKAQKIRRAASAPVDPSAQDRSVAAQASMMEAQARVELAQQSKQKQADYIDQNTPEFDLLARQSERNEQSIQDTYQKIQNTSVLQQNKSFVDFFI